MKQKQLTVKISHTLGFLLCFIAFSANSQQSFQWAQSMGGINSDLPVGLVVDIQGDVYTAGNFHNTADFDPGNGTANLISAGSTDIFISKLSTNGNLLWARRIGGTGLDSCFAICNDQSGNVLVTGWFSGAVDFDPGASVYTLATASSTIANTFILKLDPNGNFLWAKQIGNPMANLSELRSICCDSSGNFIATGKFGNTTPNKCDFDPGPATFTLNTIGGIGGSFNVAFVLKLDPNGNFIWAVNFGAQLAQNAICADASGNIYCGGAFAFEVDFDPGPGTYTLNNGGASGASGDGFILKLDGNGNFIWARHLAGGDKEAVTCLKVDCQNNVVCGGNFNMDFWPNGYSPGTGFATSGSGDVFICKFTSAGAFGWCGQIGGKASEVLRGLAIDRSGDIYLTGLFCGPSSVSSFTADFDPTSGSFTLSAPGGNDAFYCKLSSGGSLVWAHSLGAQGVDTGWGIHVSNTFAVYVAGSFMSTIDFDPFSSVANMTSTGSSDCFVLKINQSSSLTPSVVSTTNICSGETAMLTATSSGVINWYADNFSTTSLGTGAVFMTQPLILNTTFYASSGKDCGGNNIYVPVNVLVSPCARTDETVLNTARLRVFPNPSRDEVLIQCVCKHRIIIYDQLSRVVYEYFSDENDSVVPIGRLTPGVYFITADDLTKPVKLLVIN